MMERKQAEYLTSFMIDLKDELKQSELTLGGHHPLLKVLFYTIEVDIERDRITLWYGPQQEKLGECDILASEVMELLNKWRDIIEHPINETLFLQTLYDVYTSVATKTGERVAIDDILSEYVSREIYRTKKEARACLSADLFQSTKRELNDHRVSLVAATRAYTRIRRGFIWLPTNKTGGGTYISHVKFRKIPQTVPEFKEEIQSKVRGDV